MALATAAGRAGAATMPARALIAIALIRRHTFAEPDNRRLAHVCGPLDAHLRAVESTLGVILLRRDATFRIQGPGDAVDRAAAVLDGLYAKAASPIGERALQLMLAHATAPAGGAAPGTSATTGATTGGTSEPIVLHTRHTDLGGRTPNQVLYLQQMLQHDITLGIGPAGTGKTFLAVACAVDALERHGVQRIVLTRPAVEAGERLGFLPGDLAQKVDPYLRPLYDALYDLMGFDRVTKAFDKGLIEIAPLAFMRGRTLNDSFIILDEAQNTTAEQMKMFLTRLGYGSKMVVTGDVTQVDLPRDRPSALHAIGRILESVSEIAFVHFGHADVVRHKLVQDIVEAYRIAEEDTQ